MAAERMERRNQYIRNLIQRRIGYSIALSMLLIASSNLGIGLAVQERTLTSTLTDPSVWVLYLFSGVGLVTALRESVIFRFIHVLTFITTGIAMNLAEEIGQLNGVLFFVYGVLLAVQYGFLQRHFWIKIGSLIAVFSTAVFISADLKRGFGFFYGIPTIILTALLIYLFWVIFAEEIQDYYNQTVSLRRERDRNRIFVQFGRHIAGVVHNLKSALMSVEGFNTLLSDAPEDKRAEYLALQKESTDRMIDMVNNFVVAVRSYQRAERECIVLNHIVQSEVEIMKGNQEVKHKLQFEIDIPEDHTVYASPLDIIQILDNIMMNAYEAMKNGDEYKLSVSSVLESDTIIVSIADSGPGIPSCAGCTDANCLRCSRFSIGSSTKENGAGLGIVYVREVLLSLGGGLEIESPISEKGGTRVNIMFPRC